jgi:hypothetical protein
METVVKVEQPQQHDTYDQMSALPCDLAVRERERERASERGRDGGRESSHPCPPFASP